ncbi:hypothetical protein IU471_33750, partial [Nocardia elegans]|nr:hypothetical protein [Nocardia elegans]
MTRTAVAVTAIGAVLLLEAIAAARLREALLPLAAVPVAIALVLLLA